MRIEGGLPAIVVVGCLALLPPARAAAQYDGTLVAAVSTDSSLRIESPIFPPGVPATIDVFVRLPPGTNGPLLLTPVIDGEVARVVRGRLWSADAHRTETGELRFEVPIETLAEGTAVLRVTLLTYTCDTRCRPVRMVESRPLRVRRR